MMLSLNLFGTPEISLEDHGIPRFRTRKAQALLIYLAVTERKWTRDGLATLFWPETSDVTARKNLRDILPSLRRQLGEYLLFDDEIIGLNPLSQVKCDVTQFSAVLEQATTTVETDLLTATLALYRGEFLEGFGTSRISVDFEFWALRERERLHQLALMGYTTLCQRQQATGTYEAALATNRQLLKLTPWDEAAHQRQMLLLAQSGQPAAALAHFEAACQILADELDVEPDAETVTLYAAIKAGQTFTPPVTTAPAITPSTIAPSSIMTAPPPPASDQDVKRAPIPHNLPRQLTSLIGRETEIDAVQRLLQAENTALLTLVGQGGVGKTRLALAVAQTLRSSAHEHFPDGIWFVSLAGIASEESVTGNVTGNARANVSEQIAGAIAHAMNVALSGVDPLTKQILRALAPQQLLLILDNFEHLVAEQSFLLEIVQTAQQVQLLVTSREQLHLHAEHLYPVTGLPVPAGRDLDTESADAPLVDLGQYASVQLFVSRVQQRLPEFQLTPKNQRQIGLICRLLGGVPLGIELAAHLYVEQGAALLAQLIREVEELDPLDSTLPSDSTVPSDPRGLDHLSLGAIDLPVRQRSIRAVFDHSWQLLSATEQGLLRQCAIFRGGFTREAILTVADGDGATLLALVMKSLVRRDSHDRYDLHALIRQYVIDQFQREATLLHKAADKHAAYFVGLMAGQEERLLQETEFHQTLQTEIYNLRAAWDWSVEEAAIVELAQSIVCFFGYLRFAKQIQEIYMLATETIARVRLWAEVDAHPCMRNRLLGHLLIEAGSAGFDIGHVAEGEEWIAEAKTIGEALDDPGLVARFHICLMNLSRRRTEYHLMVTRAQAALHWVEKADLPYLRVGIYETLGMGLAYQGQGAESFQAANSLQELVQSRHYRYIETSPLFLLCKLYEFQQEWEAMLKTGHQAQTLCIKYGYEADLNLCEEQMIWAALKLGNFAQARTLASGCCERSRRRNLLVDLQFALYTLGCAELRLGNWSAGEKWLTEALEITERLNIYVRQIFIHIQLGRHRVEQAAYATATSHFQRALQAATKLPGLPELKALAQAGLALTHLRQGELMAARREVESFLGVEKTITPDGPDYCFMGLVIYEVLAEHQDPRATQILDHLYREVQIQATKIKDDMQRQIFLEKIVEHRKIVALATTSINPASRTTAHSNSSLV